MDKRMHMEKKSNNYIVIIVVLLLVATIITGAGLCYLSWADDDYFIDHSGSNQSTETIDSALSESAVSTEISDESREVSESEVPSSDNSESAEAASEAMQEGLQPNTVTIEQIQVMDTGEYQYIKDGKVASHKGIDVSKYQGNIDWEKVATDGVEYAFIRVGCRGYGQKGTMIKDQKFHQNMQQALQQNIPVGAYFFTQAITVDEAKEEAAFVIGELEGYEVTYPVAIDIERIQNEKARQDALSKEERTELCIVFCEAIKAAGYIPMVYGDSETFAELIIPEELSEYEFWICETDGKMTFPYEFAVWQYSHTGKVSGINNDTNISISIKEWQ